jgi:hypothetical protein
MANEWIQSSGAACYNTATPGYAFYKTGVLEAGKLAHVKFTILNMTQGTMVLDSIAGKPEYTEDGEYEVVGVATSSNLSFIGESLYGSVFNGCIDEVEARIIPFYTIKDTDGNSVFTLDDDTGVTASDGNIQYSIDWSAIADGCYQIWFTDASIDYVSDCLTVKESHPCTILLSWTNEDNAYSFIYDGLTFEPKLRVEAKKWHPKYSKEKDVFKDNAGNRTILKSETSKEEILSISEVPEYIHDALSIGLEHDFFYVDGQEYTNEEEEYTPKWRKSSSFAPVEITVIKDQLLKNNNC